MAEWSEAAAQAAASEVLKLDAPTEEDIQSAIRTAIDDVAPQQALPSEDVVTVTVNLRRDAVEALRTIAAAHDTDLTGAIHQAIATELAAVEMKRGLRTRRRS